MPRPPSGEIFSTRYSLYQRTVLWFSIWGIWFLSIFFTCPGGSQRSKSVQGRRSRIGEDEVYLINDKKEETKKKKDTEVLDTNTCRLKYKLT